MIPNLQQKFTFPTQHPPFLPYWALSRDGMSHAYKITSTKRRMASQKTTLMERRKAIFLPTKLHRIQQKGFGLIEVLISFSVVTSLVLGAAQLTLHSLFVKRRSDCSVRSVECASVKIEYLKSLRYQSDELSDGTRSEVIHKEHPKQTFLLRWNIQAISPQLKKIEIDCSSESCGEKRTRLMLFISKQLGF